MKLGFSTTVENCIKKWEAERKAVDYLDYNTCCQILEQAKERQSDALLGLAHFYMAEHYLHIGDYEQTMHYLTDCSKYFQKAQMYEYLARTYNIMGVVSDKQSNRTVALSYYYTCFQYADKYQYLYARALAEYNIAYDLTGMKQYGEAISFYCKAIEDFEQMEHNYHRSGNILRALLHCGLCYLTLEDVEAAKALWEQIQTAEAVTPEEYKPKITLLAYRACMEASVGRTERARELLGEWVEGLTKPEDIDEAADVLIHVLNLLEQMGEHTRMDQLFWTLEQIGIGEFPSVMLAIFPYESRNLLKQGKKDIYIKYTKIYFRLYEQYQNENRDVTVRMMELQDKLREVEQEQSSIRADNERLASIALYDPLTNLPNRLHLNEHLAHAFDNAQRTRQTIGVELLDIDYFKQYNDTYGHLEGDRCIEEVAGVLQSIQDPRVFCARYGGDEFMVIYEGMRMEEVRGVMEDIQEKVRKLKIPHGASRVADMVTVSQGTINRIPDRLNREWDFGKTADKALYLAKAKGRNCYYLVEDFAQVEIDPAE